MRLAFKNDFSRFQEFQSIISDAHVAICRSGVTTNELWSRIHAIFDDHPDLLKEFRVFFPRPTLVPHEDAVRESDGLKEDGAPVKS